MLFVTDAQTMHICKLSNIILPKKSIFSVISIHCKHMTSLIRIGIISNSFAQAKDRVQGFDSCLVKFRHKIVGVRNVWQSLVFLYETQGTMTK